WLAPAAALIKVCEGCRLPWACYGCRSRNSLRTPSHRISGLRSPALASSMMRLAMIWLVMTGRSARPSAMRAISNATPMTRLTSGSGPVSSRRGVLGIRRAGCGRERERSLRDRPTGAAADGAQALGADRCRVGTVADISLMDDGARRARQGVRGTKPTKGAFAIRPDGGERDGAHAEMRRVRTITCRSFRLKGSGERYYCNDFCAEAEEAESPALVPSMSEDASATLPKKAVS